jgi:hypothetical protein
MKHHSKLVHVTEGKEYSDSKAFQQQAEGASIAAGPDVIQTARPFSGETISPMVTSSTISSTTGVSPQLPASTVVSCPADAENSAADGAGNSGTGVTLQSPDKSRASHNHHLSRCFHYPSRSKLS